MPKIKRPYTVEELSSESKYLYDVLNSESDLPIVLIAASFLDNSLASILSRYFLESTVSIDLLDTGNGALGTFSSRIKMVYVLGLINDYAFKDLLIIAKIRNVMAHSHLTVDFKTPEIIEKCSSLRYIDVLGRRSKSSPPNDRPTLFSVKEPRVRFMLTVVMLNQQLLLIGMGTKHREPTVAFLPNHLKTQ